MDLQAFTEIAWSTAAYVLATGLVVAEASVHSPSPWMVAAAIAAAMAAVQFVPGVGRDTYGACSAMLFLVLWTGARPHVLASVPTHVTPALRKGDQVAQTGTVLVSEGRSFDTKPSQTMRGTVTRTYVRDGVPWAEATDEVGLVWRFRNPVIAK